MKPAVPATPLPAERACFRSDVRALGIASTADVEPAEALGDARGEQALALALQTGAPGYHAFVCGVEGPERLERVAAIVRPLLREEWHPVDWVYLHDFSHADRARAIQLPAGDGRRLHGELAALIRGLQEDLPKAFHEEAFDEEKARLIRDFERRHQEQQRLLAQLAERSGFTITQAPPGNIALVPLVDGRPIQTEEEFRALGDEKISKLEEARRVLIRELREHFERHREQQHRLDEEIHRVEREFASRIVRGRARALAARFDSEPLARQLDELAEHILDHLEPFRGESASPPLPFPFAAPEARDELAAYEVNVVVDNSRTETPPVVVVDSPTYKNLFGTIDRTVDRLGRLTTDFRRIHAGALLEADGGAVVLQADDALVEPFVWRILRRALRSGRVEIEAYDPFVMFTPSGIRPEPIRVRTKVVLLGPRWLFELLLALDEEFGDLFKVLADYSPIVERSEATTRLLCGRIARAVAEEGLLPFEAGALDALVELAVREAGDRRRLHLGSEQVLDTAREASRLATRSGRSKIAPEDVTSAVRDRTHRLDRVEELIREAIDHGLLLVDLEGERVGQLNGLAVQELGGRPFGRPSRLSATVGVGTRGVISVDRETKLSGASHDKGVLILEGFLRDRFARGRPLSLVATLVFEQSYAHVEGDSASLAELLAILSRIGEFPLRQDLAVTGSVNQGGEVQAIGGINEKVEGFFDCCSIRGLTGEQGVVFPEANVEQLALRSDVVEAIAAGSFRLHPVRGVDEALELLTGTRVGSAHEPDTLYFAVDQALDKLARQLKHFGAR